MKLFTMDCACGGLILGPREGGKARGRWLGYDECPKCRERAASAIEARQGGNGEAGAVEDESAVAKPDAQKVKP